MGPAHNVNAMPGQGVLAKARAEQEATKGLRSGRDIPDLCLRQTSNNS